MTPRIKNWKKVRDGEILKWQHSVNDSVATVSQVRQDWRFQVVRNGNLVVRKLDSVKERSVRRAVKWLRKHPEG